VLSNSSGAVSKFVNDGEAMVGLSNEDTLLRFKVGGGPVELLYRRTAPRPSPT
jgi:iron(III) transport system substrate-binding protein